MLKIRKVTKLIHVQYYGTKILKNLTHESPKSACEAIMFLTQPFLYHQSVG